MYSEKVNTNVEVILATNLQHGYKTTKKGIALLDHVQNI